MALLASPLSTAANNIVKISTRSQQALPKAQSEFQDFARFLDSRRLELERTSLPSKKKIQSLANIDISNNFGSVGNLLKNLLGGALDIGSFISGMFPGKGEKVGKVPDKAKAQPKPSVRGGKLRLGGLRALGIANAVFAGLDFATGLAEGEGVGKAGAGALGSFGGAVAGSLLAGAIGQALIPVPGVGFVLGMVGGSLGGFLGGFGADRAYEAATEGSVKEKQEQRLKENESKQRSSATRIGTETLTFNEILVKFDDSVSKFEEFVANVGNIMGVDENNPYNEPEEYPDFPEISPDEVYDGPVDGDTFFPLPGGDVGTRGNISPGQAFGAPRDGGSRLHAGLDMTHHKGSLDAPVVAYKTGKVIWASGTGSYNSGIMVDHGNGLKTKYFHVTPLVKTGDIVYGGQQIAKLFPAGNSTHLHFEVHKGGTPINPLNAGIGPGGSARRLPAPLSIDKAKENNNSGSKKAENQRMSSGVDLYPQSLPQTNILQPIQNTSQTSSPIIQPLPQSVMVAPQRQDRNIQVYPSYSQGQSYIMERQTIISDVSSGSGGSQSPMVIPVGGGSGGQNITVIPQVGVEVLNSLMKNILLTSLSST